MRAAVLTEIGSVPEPAEREEPEAADGEALIAVTASSLNPVELRVAAGRMPRQPNPPYVPGLEGVGKVVESARFAPATRVRFENDLPGFGKDGSLREMATAEEDSVVELPESVSDAEAAAAGVVGVTAHLALRRAGMTGGERVAVLGATGGVGQMAVQLARFYGAIRVVAVGRHRPTLEMLEGRDGAVPLALDDSGDLTAALQQAAGGPIDVVVDCLWGPPAMSAIPALAEEGRLVNVGNNAGVDVQLPLAAMRQVRSAVIGLSSGWTPLPDKVAAYRAVIEAIVRGEVTVAYEMVPLDEVSEAWRRQAEFPHQKLVVSMV